MSELVKQEPASSGHSILEVFPIGRFSPALVDSLNETENQRINADILCSLELRELRVMYTLLNQQIPNLGLACPLIFEPISEDGPGDIIHRSYRVTWVGDHDPFGLGDSTIFEAVTQWRPNGQFGQRVNVQWTAPDIYGSDGRIRKAAKTMMQVVKPAVFDDAYRNFVQALHVTVPCRVADDEYGIHHPDNCELCANERWVWLHKTIGDRFRPSAWLEMVTNIYGWCK